jgi:hypothetical protein
MSDHDHEHDHDHQHVHEGGDAARDELIREMARRLAETPVRDLLLQTMATFIDLAGVRLGYGPEGPVHRDLPQARLAIESVRALIGVAEAEIGVAQAKPFREPLAQLQMLYANEVDAAAAAAQTASAAEAEQPDSGLWTPGGEAGGDGPGLWTPGSN